MKLLTWSFLTIILLLSPSVALAQAGGDQPYHVNAGPYQIDVLASPSRLALGTIQYVVRVYDAENGQPVPDARVVVRARHGERGEEGWANALNSPASPDEYTARVELAEPGVWEVSVDVSSALGRVEVEVPSQTVPEPRQSSAGGLVFFGVFAVLILGSLYLIRTIRRTQRQREAPNAS